MLDGSRVMNSNDDGRSMELPSSEPSSSRLI